MEPESSSLDLQRHVDGRGLSYVSSNSLSPLPPLTVILMNTSNFIQIFN